MSKFRNLFSYTLFAFFVCIASFYINFACDSKLGVASSA